MRTRAIAMGAMVAALVTLAVFARRDFVAARVARSEAARLAGEAALLTAESHRAAPEKKLPSSSAAAASKESQRISQTTPPISSPPRAAVNRIEPFDRLFRRNPKLQALQLAAEQARVANNFEPLFHALRLSPEQIECFTANVVRREAQQLDLEAATLAKEMNDDDEAVARLREQTQADYKAAQRALLGAAAYPQFEEFENTLPLRDTVRGLAATALAAGEPFTPQQAEEVTRALILASERGRTGRILPDMVNWKTADEQVRAFLSETQFAVYQTIDPHIQPGFGARTRARLAREIEAAQAADKTR